MADAEGAVAPDGSPVALYRALDGQADATLIDGAIPTGSSILELGCGAGRVTRELASSGHRVTAVDNSAEMLHAVGETEGIEPILADILTLDLLPRRWPVALLASHFVNAVEGEGFLRAATRHVAPDGCVIIQRYEPGWVDTVEESVRHLDEVTVAVQDVDHSRPGVLTATMVYEVGEERYLQPFTAHEVDDDRLAAMAAAVGCTIDTILDDRRMWARLRRSSD